MQTARKPLVCVVSLQVQTSFQAVPLGAACVVSSIRSDPSLGPRVETRLFDFSLEDDALAGRDPERAGAEIAKKISALAPDVVGFSVYVWNRRVLERAAEELKRLAPSVATFAGGPEVTADPGSFAVGKPFDHVVVGEGETAALALVTALTTGAAIPEAVANRRRSAPEDCRALSSPWLDGTLSDSPSVRDGRGALWELARGCPFRCAYCYESKGDKKVREFPLERLERELEYFVKSGIERVFVLDPTYNATRDRALTLLSLIEKKAGDIHFNFEARAERLDRDMARAFARIPCSLQIGLQSTNEEALRLVARPTNLKEFSRKIALLNDEGVVFGLDLMYGLPGDSLSTFRASLDYAINLYPNNLEIFRLAVLPGTDLRDRAAELGLSFAKAPPYLVESTPKFSSQDLGRAADLARACDVFYTQGRAVSWFLAALRPLKLKPSQFFQDFSGFLRDPSAAKIAPALRSPTECEISQRDAERLQLAFIEKKYREKGKAFLWPVARDAIALNGAWTRALAEGETTTLELSYGPDDLFGPDAADFEYFAENACMERCRATVRPGPEGPEIDIR